MKKILVFAAAAMMLFACSKEDEVADRPFAEKADGPVFYAAVEGGTVPGTGTKVYADENLLVLWNADDRISIFNKTTYNFEYAFMGEDGDNFGVFEQEPVSGFVSGNDISQIYAVYPYSTGTKVNNTGTQITVNLPSVQAYKAKSFGIGANTMVAVTDDQFLSFKNVCGYLKFRFWGNDVTVKSVTLKGNNGEKIAGKAFITPSASNAPTVSMDGTAIDSIKMTCSQPVTLGSSSDASTEFIFVIPPTTFSNGFTVTVTDVNGQVFEKSSDQSLTISRNRLESMDAVEVDLNSDVFVEFEDDNFKAYCVSNFDTDGDGEISYSEAKMARKIDLRTYNITSLKGLEQFENLTYLRYTGYDTFRLSSLDVSHNTLLDTLYCIYNNLSELDLSNNPNLSYLDCSGNKLTQLNISGCAALEYLSCGHNQLEQLDASGCENLTRLNCNSNLLTQLNVNDCPNLLYVSCQTNKLIQLDFSSCVALDSLQCSQNQLTQLNLVNNANLTYLSCYGNHQLSALNLSGCVNLKRLVCYACNLSQLDVSNSNDLTFLECLANQLTQLDISNNANLQYLSCTRNQLTQLDLIHNTYLTRLICGSNQLTSLDVSNNHKLEEISCGNNQLTSLDVSSNTSLRTLDVSDNTLLTSLSCRGEQWNWSKLNSLNISGCTALDTLYCDWNQLTSLDLSDNTALRFIDCGGNKLTSLDVSNNTALKELSCGANQLTTLDVSNNTALTHLNCFINQLSSLDVSNNTALAHLWCYDNKLTSLDVSHNNALIFLNCVRNQITSLNLGNNSNMFFLHCHNNKLSSLNVSGLSGLRELNCHNNMLTSLVVSGNTYLGSLTAWPQSGVLSDLYIKQGQNIVYYYSNNGDVPDDFEIDPNDYGTTITVLQ